MKGASLSVAAVVCAAGAQAAIIGTTGNIVQIGAPASVLPGALPTPINAVAFDEKQFIQGAGPADFTMNPSVAPPLTPGVWGGVVNSHFIHFDPGFFGGVAFLNGSVTFDGPIIGVMLSSPGQTPPANLDVTDFLGALGTAYPTGQPFRGWNGSGQIMVVGATIRFNNVACPAPDFEQFRVVTATPAPGSVALLALGGLIAGRRKRREVTE